MPVIAYEEKRFSSESLDVIAKANAILEDYDSQGFVLTLRQLYYQFVARDWIPNNLRSYKRLGSIVNDGRMCGYIDWLFLEDRTRNITAWESWDAPSGIIDSASRWYHRDLWEDQEYRVEVWIEKDALVGVIEPACRRLDIPFFSCRGYTSQSEMWRAGQRLLTYEQRNQTPVILHFGDHDPSGMDMSRDIVDRLYTFMGGEPEFVRVALNSDQISQYNPPPNPAKLTDSRARGYIAQFGYESWELDALEPRVIDELIENNVANFLDQALFDDKRAEQEEERQLLLAASRRWNEVKDFLSDE